MPRTSKRCGTHGSNTWTCEGMRQCPRPIGYRHTKNRRDGNNETGEYRKTGTSGPGRAPPTRLSVAPLIAATLRYRGNKHARLEMPIRIPKPVNTEIAEQGETDERQEERADGDRAGDGQGRQHESASATFPFQKCPFKEIKIPIPPESAGDQNGTTAIAL